MGQPPGTGLGYGAKPARHGRWDSGPLPEIRSFLTGLPAAAAKYPLPLREKNIPLGGSFTGYILSPINYLHTSLDKAETTTDTRYFLSSVTDVERFAYAVRKHWAIENQLHWCLDVIFDEDASRARKDMSPLNLNVLRKTALALCKNADFGRRLSIQKKRFAAALNPQRLLDILFV